MDCSEKETSGSRQHEIRRMKKMNKQETKRAKGESATQTSNKLQ